MVETPAIVGGKPLFDELIPIVRPEIPPFEELAGRYEEVLSSRMITNSKYARMLEASLREHLDVEHVVVTSSCTAGMMLLLKGLGITGEVILPSFTFMATPAAVAWAGATPVFVDADPEKMVVDPEAVERAVTERTQAIFAMHNFGRPADVERLEEIASRHSLHLFFDAAHGMGTLHKGKPVGGFGEAESFSLSPTKLVTAGEGGVLSTNSDDIAEMIKVGRDYGNPGNYDCLYPGLNARMSEANAVLGLASLERLDAAVARRNEIAQAFKKGIGKLPGVSFQQIDDEDRSSYKDFVIVVDEAGFGLSRDELAAALLAENVDTRKYYVPACHKMTAFADKCIVPEPLPGTDLLEERCLSLPIWSGMSDDIASGIVAAVNRIHAAAKEIRAGKA